MFLQGRAALDNLLVQQKEGYANSTNRDSTISPSVSTARQSFTNADDLPTDPLMPDLEDTANLLNTGIFSGVYDDEDVGAEADLNNLETTMNKFDFSSVKTASTPIETNKALLKDEEAEDVDVHLYRSVIGSLMYLTASRPDIMIFSTAKESVSTAGALTPVGTAGTVQQVNIIIPSSSETTELQRIRRAWDDEELAQKLHEEKQARFNAEQEAKFNAEQEELLASETSEDEANPPFADINWDDVQAQIEADEDLAQKLLEEEGKNLSLKKGQTIAETY
ncbi:hypothetical protein Tco_1312487 [Tanacetum coccineum]